MDVRPWLDLKWAAILAHRGQVERERPLPGILARLPAEARHRIIGTAYSLASGRPGTPPTSGKPHKTPISRLTLT